MKKYLIFSILSLIFTIASLPVGAVKRINANPVNIAAVIVEMVDSVKIQREFNYYGYTLYSIEDGFKVMKSSNGNEIRYSFQDEKALDNHPVVIVKSTETPLELDNRLNELQFNKEGYNYRRLARRDDRHITQCTPVSGNTFLFQCIKR